jgi:uncharacterized DUF497 family protein
VEFDWDEGNRDKNLRHGVHDWEIEEALDDPGFIIVKKEWVDDEERTILLGRATGSGKYLKVVYTLRRRGEVELRRPISAVEMSRRERRRYTRGR